MAGLVCINGEWLPGDEASVPVWDRGFLMADAVYEVTTVLGGRLVDFDGHHARLCRSLAALDITNPHDRAGWLALHRDAVARNALDEGTVYIQVSRGNPGMRGFDYPPADLPPTEVVIPQHRPGMTTTPALRDGIRVALLPDLRWHRRDIKTVQLLWPSRAKALARAEGADEAWLTEDGFVTEGTSNNAWILQGDSLVTRDLSSDILAGVTRAALIGCLGPLGITLRQRAFTPAEAQSADEAFITSATAFVTPVVAIGGVQLGDGRPGPVTRQLQRSYLDQARRQAI